ncbi:acyl-CoA N-acyltransferase [Polychaeton citri CBS 116435]|uniref:Acyl-CoA N-acyltransferase n=1 Tax=Polychaeton citri CBS 116435 TaxID=1314669 RepID=A0A9P4UTY2_9PEZI|nr:acyl-CoA N-acyltransferase [Polychaeton citri CBS 116435]
MSFTLLPLIKSDVPACVQIYFDAFQNPHSLACWPRIPSVRQGWEEMFYKELQDPRAHFLKVFDVETGRMVGFAKWVEPTPGETPEFDSPQWPEGADVDLCNETFSEWARQHKEMMGDRGHWYLEIVATDPKYQGKGAGRLMLKYGCERADRDVVEAFVEASPEAVGLYEKMGFREAGKTDTFIDNERVKAVWYRNLFMVRPPKNA